MMQEDAVRIVNRSTFRPGWSWSARPGYAQSEIIVEFKLDTVDTSFPGRYGNYTMPRKLAWPKVYDVAELATREELLYLLLLEVQDTQLHEDREFLRYWDGDQWVAPFHPHNELGRTKWESILALAGIRRKREEARAR